MNQDPIAPVLCRYELKFVIHESLIEPISRFVSCYCSLDKYSEIKSDNFYMINSLYLDTPDYLFLRRRIADEDGRYNMRVRMYSEDPADLNFLEIKYKTGSILKKIRAKIHGNDWPAVILDPSYEPDLALGIQESENADKFIRLAITNNIEPKVIIRYRRKAYISDYDDYARVTFDREIRCAVPHNWGTVPQPGSLHYLDHENLFADDSNVVLELKCYTNSVPLWMIDLIRTFDLHRCSFSKYLSGIREANTLIDYDCNDRKSILV
ncbi:polyphosphate polymerase domain-containing protein [Chitinispirillales bacterium ANBcel5]|uniref:polyphosphate polymerase domain-containing protein n=1 Tax=Cellulosispirillum alkaliphilum TaxID=3039283 RepID=UPI002A58CFFE|nr:polyphosphate polymerase domain-containing protein [Chitinispirillales bacterium ANBcel5]